MIKLLHGDCLEKMKEIESESVDMVLADPPYGTTACAWDTVIPFEPMWEQLKRIAKDRAAVVLFGSQPFTSALVMSNPKMFKYEWVWEKSRCSNFLQSNYQPQKWHENILIFSKGYASYTKNKGKMKFYPQMWGKTTAKNKGQTAWTALKSWNGRQRDEYKLVSSNETGKRFPKSILEIKNDNGKIHPTQKPVALMEYLIKTYTNEGETVLDFTMGSGTTGVACVKTGRSFIGIELDKEYLDMANRRIWKEKQSRGLFNCMEEW